MAGQWKLSFHLPLTFEEGNTCTIIPGWKLSLTKPSFCSSNLLQSEGLALGVFGMLKSLANGLVFDGQIWVLAEYPRWPWNGKTFFSFSCSSRGDGPKIRGIKPNQIQDYGAVSLDRFAGERGWDRTEEPLQSLALKTVRAHADVLLLGYTNTVPPPAPSCIWMALGTALPRETLAR